MMAIAYRPVATPDGKALVREGYETALSGADAAAFDCDGVLVDSRDSYDATTARTMELLLDGMSGIRLSWNEKTSFLIHKLRRTGGFNNDWDTTYALTLFAALSLPPSVRTRITEGKPKHLDSVPPGFPSETFEGTYRLVEAFSKSARGVGHESVDRFVGTIPEVDLRLFRSVKAYTGYPGTPPRSLLSTLYDEIYHGPSLFKDLHGFGAAHHGGRGLIERDRVLVTEAELDAVLGLFSRGLALDTGRPRKAAEHTLGPLLSRFDHEASMFLGDWPRAPPALGRSFLKPSPLSLLRVMDALGSSNLLYVGDSAEDLLMARAAKGSAPVEFAGVYGSAYNPADQSSFFEERGADLIVPSARSLPAVYRRIRES